MFSFCSIKVKDGGGQFGGRVATATADQEIVATSVLVDVGEKDLPEGGRFLPKPYQPREVADVLHELTGGR